MQQKLQDEHDIYVAVFTLPDADGADMPWIRVSAQVFIERSDIERIGELIPKVLAELRAETNKVVAPLLPTTS